MRHRSFRHLAILVALVLTVSSLIPGFSRSAVAQSDASGNEWESEQFGYVIGWEDPWLGEPAAGDPERLVLIDGDITVSLRGEEEGLTPGERLEQEIGQVVYLNGTEAEITEDSESVATAEWRSESQDRLVSVIALPDAGANLVLTLVAPSDDFDDARERVGNDVTLDGDAIVSTGGESEGRPGTDGTDIPDEDETDEPTEEATAEPTEDDADEPNLKLPTEEALGEGATDGSYSSPSFGYSFEWDDDEWEIPEDGEFSSDGYDTLLLYGNSGSLLVYAFEDYDGDPEACLEGEAEYYSEDVGIDDWELAENADGDPLSGVTDTSAYGVYTMTYTDPESSRTPSSSFVQYLECRDIGDGTVLVIAAFSLKSSYNDHIDAVIEVTDTIVLYDEDAEATETPDADLDIDEDEPAEDEATATPEDEGDTGGSRPGENLGPPSDRDADENDAEEEATPGEEEPEEPAEGSGASGLDGTVYTSPGFGFSLDIPTTWTIEDEQVAEGEEQLVLNNGTSTVTLWATTGYDGDDLAGCVSFAAEASGKDLTLDVRSDGSAFQGSDDLNAYAAFTYDEDDVSNTWFVRCSWIEEGESVLIVIQDVPTDEYASERRARRQLENLIEMP